MGSGLSVMLHLRQSRYTFFEQCIISDFLIQYDLSYICINSDTAI